ncbi:nascent polypeptide-associated complex subunit alpha-like protein 1 [Histomonas meleagridis]|uniref:nascent polypeptide-associated complex subunit alpha-like protein 1 n=1 Tax=Histomonas meleagridis TaxID=135588 RepID=UPI003559B4B1|nr:nascent polypeptide-associated complex subunit alpha-like protein 1 [Histomonas meleagridis]KAH0800280.1 nascent polypeptide-associated complex subunit alpha-like protein 1 [Histomonas meleagridis]
MAEKEAAAAPAETKVEEVKPEDKVEEVKDEEKTEETKTEEPVAAPRKVSRAEKKMKEALLKHNLKPLEKVSTVMMRKGAQIMWTFASPDVYFIDDVYIVFGEPQMQDPGARAVEQLKNSAAAAQEAIPKEPTTTVVEDDQEGEVDATGLKEEDINTIMQQSNVSRARAVQALRDADGDLVTAVMNLAL